MVQTLILGIHGSDPGKVEPFSDQALFICASTAQ
jgi:hypothetical protein